ncbi:N-lysine methyltransferase SMYD2 [Eurytemora carolleeae]|uniref:N-lysine methyltransferase SMYD2 n=1 Tax=Eurytemora carolleeae TaxID=1294199 RepID=UPI000C763FDC|nr:N-lysine methyltransferase SMYD2 [Eurytemora carolleeae]|eukprot:XP_023344711.1 N-lysine methyltransferase SMYD2-like [Eurytemora affinis]
MKPIGGGLYCTAALFNHSCDPNIMRFNQGKRMVSVSCRSIRAGEKIYDCYGLPWYSKPWEERQRILIKFYRFTCSCLPCKESWPVSELLAKAQLSGLSRVKCSICGSIQARRRLETEIPCSCGALIDLTEIPLEKIAKLNEELQDLLCVKMDWRKGMQVRLELETLLEKYIATPSLEHFLSNILVWRALWTLTGSKKIVKIM